MLMLRILRGSTTPFGVASRGLAHPGVSLRSTPRLLTIRPSACRRGQAHTTLS